ncbi:type II toxin-antitoxin system RelE/ParE family toxin [Chelatococcus asaccharovorans]|uniref:type II toxin-antitoxin system RelE/ParE family toxin n=1 Tax=Chelatococcus asaccharovorans TaxID=28210 RepID=UPI00224C68D7|nr:type II toxin-antitoxin system RelE/ParE family toxin [Chelatococcus asaccharovorans]CAH1672097.1 Type II toxin-antitoxin system RelE/ParE family toxin [Chelatococcus asaccharovorans]CAH1676486.1 Type II toxin-antitoxin system RelE/ParE family toxin [Chelatococcus asaccharovorans]
MIEVRQTAIFSTWFSKLRDRSAKARIAVRIDRLALGNAGDAKPVGAGISELRINYGPGYRVYFTRIGDRVVILLCGGDKSTQDEDIRSANALASELGE